MRGKKKKREKKRKKKREIPLSEPFQICNF
jgi:hypothetical protein